VIALQTTDPFSRQRGRLTEKNKYLSAEKKKSKIKSGQGSQREARYPDELDDCLSAARRTPTPVGLWDVKDLTFYAAAALYSPETFDSSETHFCYSSVVVKALSYKPEGHGFETQLWELIFSIYLIIPAALGSLAHSASNRNGYQRHTYYVSGE
jgi:hypothetical protein